MKRNLLTALLLLLMSCLVAFTLTACGGNGSEDVTVSISESSVTLTVGDTKSLTATASDGSTIEWSSDNASVASVNTRGLITAVAEGTATIKAASGDAYAECSVTVNAKEVVTITVSLDGVAVTTASVERYEEITLTATASDGSAISWASSAPNIASVSGGVVSGLYPGETNIIATTASGGRTTVALTVTYNNAPEGYKEIANYEQNKVPVNTWGYWNDLGYEYATIPVNYAEYLGDSDTSEAGSIRISFYTSSGTSEHGLQIVYRTAGEGGILTTGAYYALNLKIESDASGSLSLNGTEIELVAGETTEYTVYFQHNDDGRIYAAGDYTNIFYTAIFMAIDNSKLAQATLTVSDISWTEYTPEDLAAPSLAIDNKVVAVTDSNDSAKVGSYVLGFFTEGSSDPVYKLTVQDGSTIDDSKIDDGTYTVKIMAVAVNASVKDSEWSAEGVSYTVSNGGVVYNMPYGTEDDAKADPGTWYFHWAYYAEGNTENPIFKYDKGTIYAEVIANTGDWYCTQIFYKDTSLDANSTYTLSLNIYSDTTGTITVNGKTVELVADTITAVEVVISGSGTSVSIQLGTNAGGIDMASCKLTISDVTFEKFEGTLPEDPEDPTQLKNGGEADAVANAGTWYYWNDQNWCGSLVRVTEATNEDDAVTLTYSYVSGSCWFGMQLFYKDSSLTAGESYTLTLDIEAEKAGEITVNGTVVTLSVGQNHIEVSYNEADGSASISIQFGVADEEGSNAGTSQIDLGTFVITNVEIN